MLETFRWDVVGRPKFDLKSWVAQKLSHDARCTVRRPAGAPCVRAVLPPWGVLRSIPAESKGATGGGSLPDRLQHFDRIAQPPDAPWPPHGFH